MEWSSGARVGIPAKAAEVWRQNAANARRPETREPFMPLCGTTRDENGVIPPLKGVQGDVPRG